MQAVFGLGEDGFGVGFEGGFVDFLAAVMATSRPKVELLLGERGLMMRRLIYANGDVTEFAPARLKRQPGGAKKDGK